jgi:hypothetical protein
MQLPTSPPSGAAADAQRATTTTTSTSTTREARELHVDRQTTSGLWPHPVFMRIERVLHFVDREVSQR